MWLFNWFLHYNYEYFIYYDFFIFYYVFNLLILYRVYNLVAKMIEVETFHTLYIKKISFKFYSLD